MNKQRTAKVAEATDPSVEARRLWKIRKNKGFDEIRQTLHGMSSGRGRCMYCEDSAATSIDHFWPLGAYPEHAFSWPNLLLACSFCNSHAKREQFPLDTDGGALLVDPTATDPFDHLSLDLQTGSFRSRTPRGAATIDVFALNLRQLPEGRRAAMVSLMALVLSYARGDADRARLKETARGLSFSAAVFWLLHLTELPAAELIIGDPAFVQAVKQHDVQTWFVELGGDAPGAKEAKG